MLIPRVLVISGLFFGCLSASAAVSDQEFADLKRQMQALAARVDALESENTQLKEDQANYQFRYAAPSKKETVSIKGDVRYRYEGIDQEGSKDHERNRVRARVALTAAVPNDVELGIGLASGSDDPASANQTLGSAGSTKDIRLNLAYIKWSATRQIDVIAGKHSNIWFRPHKSELLWDSDYTPEGLAVTYTNQGFFANAGLHFLESDTRLDNHRFAWGLQTGYSYPMDDGSVTAALSYHSLGVKDRSVYFGDPDEFFGNSFTCVIPAALVDCTYDNDYRIVEIAVMWQTQLQDLPLSLYGDFARNEAADQLDTAWASGISLGKVKGRGTWQVDYRYQDIEADSVFGLLAGRDFGGGGTDASGHILKGSLGINKKWSLGLSYFMTEKNIDVGVERDHKRIQIDSQFKF